MHGTGKEKQNYETKKHFVNAVGGGYGDIPAARVHA